MLFILFFQGNSILQGGEELKSDINGSVNILRKYLNECNAKALRADAVRALVNVPCQRINVLCTSPSLYGGAIDIIYNNHSMHSNHPKRYHHILSLSPNQHMTV